MGQWIYPSGQYSSLGVNSVYSPAQLRVAATWVEGIQIRCRTAEELPDEFRSGTDFSPLTISVFRGTSGLLAAGDAIDLSVARYFSISSRSGEFRPPLRIQLRWSRVTFFLRWALADSVRMEIATLGQSIGCESLPDSIQFIGGAHRASSGCTAQLPTSATVTRDSVRVDSMRESTARRSPYPIQRCSSPPQSRRQNRVTLRLRRTSALGFPSATDLELVRRVAVAREGGGLTMAVE